MLERCDFRQCGECSCRPNQCRVQGIDPDRALNTVLAKHRASNWISDAIVYGLAFALIAFSFVYVAVPDGKRQALRAQENVHVVSR